MAAHRGLPGELRTPSVNGGVWQIAGYMAKPIAGAMPLEQPPTMLCVLAVDDEPAALAQLTGMLRADARVGRVLEARGPAGALRDLGRLMVSGQRLDAVFLDLPMPDLDGLDFARLLGGFAHPPSVVFVTSREDFAVPAFELGAVDYLLKPVRPERLAETVRRIDEAARQPADAAPRGDAAARAGTPPRAEQGAEAAADPGAGAAADSGRGPEEGGPALDVDSEVIPVELGGRVLLIPLSEVRYVEAQGDYVRLHTTDGETHLLRTSLRTLAQRWRSAGFVRIHRSTLVSARHITELRRDGGQVYVHVAGRRLQVSRRLARSVRDLLVRRFHRDLQA